LARRPAAASASAHVAAGVTRTRGGRLEEVRDAALTLFARDGYAGTNMTDIARAVNLEAPSLYNHIASKGDLLREICVHALDGLLALQQVALEQADPVSRLRAMTESHVSFSATHPREIIITSREFIHLSGPARQEVLDLRRRYERGFRDLIEAGRGVGLFDAEHSKLSAYAIIEMGLAVAQWFRATGQLSVAEVSHDYGKFALRIVGCREELG
jgi:AcrR family transcriptional regulator